MRQSALSLALRSVPAALLMICASLAAALEIEDRRRFGPADAARSLRILSTTDTAIFAPRIESYLRTAPEIGIDYIVASSTDHWHRKPSPPEGCKRPTSSLAYCSSFPSWNAKVRCAQGP